MDVITQSCVKEFLSNNDISSKDDSTDFQVFANFSVLSKEYCPLFDLDDVSVDEGTPGIDGVAIIVNGKMVNNVEQIEDLIEMNPLPGLKPRVSGLLI